MIFSPALLALLTVSLQTPSPTYQVTQSKGVSWFTRGGERLWSMGVDCTDSGGKSKPDNPGYNADDLFPSRAAWVRSTADRYKEWGVNTLGGWSDHDDFQAAGRPMPYIEVLHLGSYDKAPWNDLFSAEMEKTLSDAAAKLIPPLKNDPNLIGYCTDNELGWWDDSLFVTYFKFGPEAPGKQKMVAVLRDLYHDDFAAFLKEWKSTSTSFDGLLKETRISLRPGTSGIRAVIAFNQALATQYYSLVYRLVKREDPTHLILGDRYQQYYNLETVRASKPYIDVASTNAGAEWLDGTYAKFYFENLYRMTGKPVLITEFYFTARENRTGNRNTGEYFPTVQTQAERARGFATCLQQLASQPWIVGAHWFQFYDEPPKGRGDGEDYNQGLVDIHGVPYEGMIAALQHAQVEKAHEKGLPNVQAGIPHAPEHPMADHLLKWNRDRAYLRSEDAEQFADLYATYDGANLYIGVVPMDFVDPSLYEDYKEPEVDRAQVTLTIGKWSGSVRFGGDKGQKATPTGGIAEVMERPGLKHILAIRIPAATLGLTRLKKGQTLPIKALLTSHARGFQMTWDQQVTLN